MIAVLGAGPHGQQLAAVSPSLRCVLYDDHLKGFEPVTVGAGRHPWLVGAAWPKVRRQIAEKITDSVWSPYRSGQVVFPGARLGVGAQLGQHVHVQWNAVVSHGCHIGDFVTICPGAVLSGEVIVEDDVFIGAHATVIHGGITIGRGAVIGAGAVVIEDVPAGATVAGVPARPL